MIWSPAVGLCQVDLSQVTCSWDSKSTWAQQKRFWCVRSKQKWSGGNLRGCASEREARPQTYSIHSRFLVASAAPTADSVARRVAFPHKTFQRKNLSSVPKIWNNKRIDFKFRITNWIVLWQVRSIIESTWRVAEHKNKLSSRVLNGPQR